MCLIITGTSAKIRATLLGTKGLTADIFQTNGDGIGVMYKNKRGLRVIKLLPKTLNEVTRFIDQLPQDDRALSMHWRWKTHGVIDLANCHPYDVVSGKVAMMHNGVLETGNDSDMTKSDTWHFIKDYLADSVAASSEVVHAPSFVRLVAEFIGDNRFVFMDDTGRMSIVNKDQGVEIDGMWFSNTYAWSPDLLDPSYKSRYTSYIGDYGNFKGSTLDDEGWPPSTYSKGKKFGFVERREFLESVIHGDAELTRKVLDEWPHTTVDGLFKAYRPVIVNSVGHAMAGDGSITARLTPHEEEVVEKVIAGEVWSLGQMAARSAGTVADVLCYYFNWEPLAPLALGGGISKTDALAARRLERLEPEVSEEEESDDVKFFTYEDHSLRVYRDDQVACWGYETFDGQECVDHGFGYDSSDEAVTWACQELDKVLGGAFAEAH